MIVRKLQAGSKRDERGSALVTMVLVSAVLASLSAAVLCTSVSGTRERRSAQEDLRARYVCQAGLSAAVFDVERGQSGNLGDADHPVTWGGARYYVQRTDLAGGMIQLTATGVDERAGACMELVLHEVPTTSYRYGAFGKEWFRLRSNAHVDSYDSTTGTYAGQATNGSGTMQHALTNGDIGSNGPITLDQNAKVWGDAPCGPSQTTTVLGNAICTGTTAAATSMQTLPTVTLPAIPSTGNLSVSGSSTMTSGPHAYGTLRVRSNATLTITGPATIVCTNFQMDSNSSFRVNSTAGPVQLYVIDNFVLSQNALMFSLDHDPHDLAVTLLSDNVQNPETNVHIDTVDFNSNSKLYGTLLAPSAAITINSNFELFGSLVARSIDMSSNSFLHFDESLDVMTAAGPPDWEIVCWRPLPYEGPTP
jgi:hypothetical protein